MKKESKSLEFIRKLNKQLCANINPYIVTNEEEKFLRLFGKIAETWSKDENNDYNRFQTLCWSLTEGLKDITPLLLKKGESLQVFQEMTGGSSILGNSQKEQPIISFNDFYKYAMEHMHNKMYIIKDAHNLLEKNNSNYVHVVRIIKDLLIKSRLNSCNIILLAPQYNEIIDLQNDIVLAEMPLPDEKDISELIDKALTAVESNNLKIDVSYRNTKKNKIVVSKNENAEKIKEKIIFNLRGLTENEISRTISFAVVNNNGLNENCIQEIQSAKKQIIENGGILKFISSDSKINVGGHDVFKKYIEGRALYLNPKMRETYSLKAPKGVLMAGISGSGKSTLARYLAQEWNIPLIRLDMGAVFGKYLGESENNLRKALAIAEANAPCIIWIDELEKALGGSGNTDGGTSLRILGNLLTWLQEKDSSMVYLFATANSLNKLPQELKRAGRFDATFWADIPTKNECKDIFKIKCLENNFQLGDIQYESLADYAFEKQMTGAEIEHCIIQAVYATAVEANNSDEKIKINLSYIRNAMAEITANAHANQHILKEDREKALKEYIFTSTEMKKYIENNILKS